MALAAKKTTAARSRNALKQRARPTRRQRDDQRTRQQLLEAGGQIFAAHGFDRATGKEICRKAHANAAAINYHFGGISGLYAAVLQEAHNRLVTFEALSAAVSDKPDAKAKLRAVLELFARAVTGPAVSSWVLRVIGREMVAPSPALRAMDEKVRLPKARIMKGIIAEILGLSEDHPAVARGCISVVAPCFMLLIADREMITRVFPKFRLSSTDADALAEHLMQFSLAGLAAIAAGAQSQSTSDPSAH